MVTLSQRNPEFVLHQKKIALPHGATGQVTLVATGDYNLQKHKRVSDLQPTLCRPALIRLVLCSSANRKKT